jgi:hypothetical protein
MDLNIILDELTRYGLSENEINNLKWTNYEIEGNKYIKGESSKIFIIANDENEIVEIKAADIK